MTEKQAETSKENQTPSSHPITEGYQPTVNPQNGHQPNKTTGNKKTLPTGGGGES
ncbi:hypothetical protein KUV57_12725 [Epibacterium sp. DP7N7-1]|nr:hypothetical protein [Epibacterium sp. DP7N7-1]